MTGFEWADVRPGDVLVFRSGKLARRVLVDVVEDPIRADSSARMVWGIETTQYFRPRWRRRQRRWWSDTRPFYVWTNEVVGIERGDVRIASLRLELAEARGERT